MKNKRTISCGQPPQYSVIHHQATRSGVTLIEVLMSLLVMGVGVTAVATLFPLSILRSIQGTQLTNAALLRYNAEALIDIDIDIVLDPDRNSNRAEHLSQTYIIDPLGYHQVTGQRDSFGNGGLQNLVRYSGIGVFALPDSLAQAAATNLVANPDSWVKVFDDIPLTSGLTSVGLSTDIDAATAARIPIPTTGTPEKPPSRVVLTDTTGKKSITRYISSVTGTTLSWDEDANSNGTLDPNEDRNNNGVLDSNIPASFSIGKVRVETRETRYTWLLTVANNSSGVANVHVVVFFRRPFGTFDEHVFSIGNGADNVERITPREYRITFDSSNPDQIPFIQKGGFLFDVENGRWYRILKVVEENSSTKRITLDKTPPNNETIQHAMFPRGIVDVYPITPKTP